MQDISNAYTIPEQSSGKESDLSLTVNMHENDALENTSNLDVELPDIPLQITTGKPQKGGFLISESDETFSEICYTS